MNETVDEPNDDWNQPIPREVTEGLPRPDPKTVSLISALRANPGTRHFLDRDRSRSHATEPGEYLRDVGRPPSEGLRPYAKRTRESEPIKEASTLDLVVAYANGATREEIAKRYGLHVQTVRKRLREVGVISRNHKNALSEQDIKLARTLLSEGDSAGSVANHFGVAHTTLLRTLKRLEESPPSES